MSAFFDTNVLVYAQQQDPKGDKARAILEEGGTISVQVLNEFVSVLRKRQGKSWDEIDGAVDDVLALVEQPLPISVEIHDAARKLAREHDFSFYDALIVAAALSARCVTLFSEDMQHGRAINGMTITNPFLA
jgi:predicted nucleic acid-binding protein